MIWNNVLKTTSEEEKKKTSSENNCVECIENNSVGGMNLKTGCFQKL